MDNIIDKVIPSLRILSGNVEDVAIMNMLNCKLSNLVSLAGIRFKQFNNGNIIVPSYYAINFMGSGEKKDYTVDNINSHLLPFIQELIKNHIENYKRDFYKNNIELEKDKKKKETLLKQYEEIRVDNFELEEPNYTGLYAEARQYDKIGFGCIFIRISEFGDYIENIASGNASKKEVYQKLKNIYEGKISPSIIAGSGDRKTITNMPVQCLLYSDFENLKNPKTKKPYIASLKTGVARRSFIYMNTKERNLTYPLRHEERNDAIFKLKEISKEYKNIFNLLLNKSDKVLLFSQEADDLIYDYECYGIDYFNNNKNQDIIVRTDIKESFWKIQKLAVIYSSILNPESNLVNAKYVQMAIDFYNKIKNGLITVIETRELTVVEKFAKYFYTNKEKPYFLLGDLRKLRYINGTKFGKQFLDIIEDIQEELQENYKCLLYEYNGSEVTGNSKAYQVKEL